jgi:hypothetical protein
MSMVRERAPKPLPDVSALKKLTLKNSSRPFDDEAAVRHLHDVEDELAKADSALIDKLLN